ncbi:hypothetical protein COLO4_01755 [Corchorus olitorius]|uniref:Uncharacterized protein n=1 Tax=Corchorus olitorius TaxID=93759 RepID=A0A1R3L231_9ROSI|nr:hypothetical protein COLO4_01755 [Corchorus olitorius]
MGISPDISPPEPERAPENKGISRHPWASGPVHHGPPARTLSPLAAGAGIRRTPKPVLVFHQSSYAGPNQRGRRFNPYFAQK